MQRLTQGVVSMVKSSLFCERNGEGATGATVFTAQAEVMEDLK
jgi:hypothetical protein